MGTGDDAAVFAPTGEPPISTDTIVEGRHFRLDLSSPRQIGARSVVQSAADVAAMGARVIGVVVSIAVPPSTAVEVVTEINQAYAAAARDLGAASFSVATWWSVQQIVITVTALGAMGRVASGSHRWCQARRHTRRQRSAGGLGWDWLCCCPVARTTREVRRVRFRLPGPTSRPHTAGCGRGPGRKRAMTDISDGLIEELITHGPTVPGAGGRRHVGCAEVRRACRGCRRRTRSRWRPTGC